MATRRQAILATLAASGAGATLKAGGLGLLKEVSKYTAFRISLENLAAGTMPDAELVAVEFTYRGETISYTFDELWEALKKG